MMITATAHSVSQNDEKALFCPRTVLRFTMRWMVMNETADGKNVSNVLTIDA